MARKGFGGHDLTNPINRIQGKVALAVNVRAYFSGSITLRALLTDAILTVANAIQTISRLNDSTPAGPVGGFTYVIKDAGGFVYSGVTGTLVAIGQGLSVNPVSLVPFRPNTSVQPWDYMGDAPPTPTGSITYATIHTKYAIDGTSVDFNCSGMVKVRSDGLIYKMGIKEPQLAPTVSTSGTTTTGTDDLPATTIPWTNVGGANPSYNYGQTSGGDGTAPVVISTPAGAQTIQLVVTGSATVNGATHAPGDVGPATSSYPANFTGSGPKIVLGAFTDGSGNVLTGTSPVPLLANIGAGVTLMVPAGAVQFQIGIDSSANTFSANSGSFTVNWTLVTSAIATVVSTLGDVTTYYWGDSPHSGPVATYIWKNPNDSGSGIPRSIGTAAGSVSNNSWEFDSSPEDGTVPLQWNTLDSGGSVTGSIPVFTPALESEGYQDFNMCVVGSLFIPAAGTYTFTFQFKDQILVGFGAGTVVTTSGFTNPTAYRGQTISVVNGLPLVLIGGIDGSGSHHSASVTMSFASSQSVQVEIDYDYWEHTGRSLFMYSGTSTVIPPLPSGVRTNVSYIAVYRSSLTGALSNGSPASTPQVTPVLDNTVTVPFSPDPQVDKYDLYRQDVGLPNYTYVATGPNDGLGGTVNGVIYNTPIVDSLSDTAAAANPILQFDNFEPFPSIDLPKSGVVNVSGDVLTWVSGDQFNIRWLPGTIVEIGSPTQLAYTAIRRPSSTTSWDFTGITNSIPDGTNLVFNIAEPALAAQPLAYLFGPTDNINFMFGVGDPLRPGTLYWCKGSNLDSAPDTNQMDVTDPSEPLVNGAMSGGRGVLFSIRRAWVIMPNFFNAEATATGTSGSTWTLQATSITRGLFIPRCLAVSGGGTIFFRVDDGIHVSPGGLGSESITDGDLYPIFSHEGSVPVAVVRSGITIYPSDDTQPQKQQFQYNLGYLYWDYFGIDGHYHTLVFDEAAGGWIYDLYSNEIVTHASNEDESVQGILTGGLDTHLRSMTTSGGIETPTGTLLTPAIGRQGFVFVQEITVEYSSNANITMSLLAADATNGSYGANPVTLPSTGGVIAKTKFLVSANKFKLGWIQFQSTDPTFRIFGDGLAIRIKSWGAKDAFISINPFSIQNPWFPPTGGFGGEV